MKLVLLLCVVMMCMVSAQPSYFFDSPPPMFFIGGEPGYVGTWVGTFGGAGAGEMYADGIRN